MFQDIPYKLKKFYHTNDVYKFIDNLNKKKFVEVSTIGHTKQGTPLKVIHIKPDNNQKNNDIIWIDGGIFVFTLFKQIFKNHSNILIGTHAREWITISSMVYIFNELIHNRNNLPIYMRNIHFVLMPIVNPDG